MFWFYAHCRMVSSIMQESVLLYTGRASLACLDLPFREHTGSTTGSAFGCTGSQSAHAQITK